MTDRLPIFHIGANKAGSTTMQRALFARHPEVLNLGKPSFDPELWPAIDSIRKEFSNRHPDWPRLGLKELRDAWGCATASSGGRVPVVSYEELIRSYFYGDPDQARLPKVITEMAGPVRVVIITRHQVRLIESLYIHKANMANYLSVDQWLATQPEWFTYGYRFHEIAEVWAKVVGDENVGVFMFEELVQDSSSFARKLCNFIGIDSTLGASLLSHRHENVRKSQRIQTYVQLRTAFLPRVSLGPLLPAGLRRVWRAYLEGGPRSDAKLPTEWLSRIEEYYRHDNRKLAEHFQLPLQSFGYPI